MPPPPGIKHRCGACGVAGHKKTTCPLGAPKEGRKDRSGGLQGHKKQPDASGRVVKLKECPRCHVEHPQPEYSNAGWQGLGWCLGCRIRYVMFGRRAT